MDFLAHLKIHKGAVNVVKENELCETLHQTNSKKASTSSIACSYGKKRDRVGETKQSPLYALKGGNKARAQGWFFFF